jgi:uncharacterized membrane protein YphA (DoxX/SURF4 family)
VSDTEAASLLIRISVGTVMVLFGIHQIIKPYEWKDYIPSWLARLIMVPKTMFLQVHGLGNLALGILFLIGFWPQVFDWIVLGWWVTILPFALYVKWSLAARDMAIIAALGAVILLQGVS